MTNMLSASGGLRPPDPLTRGTVPGPRWGLCPQTLVIGSCSALHGAPQPLTPSAAYERYLTPTSIRYDTRCYFNVRSKADISELNLAHGNNN